MSGAEGVDTEPDGGQVGENPGQWIRSRITAIRSNSDWALRYVGLLLLLVLLLVATTLNPSFWSVDNLRNIATQNAPIALVSLGMTYALIGRALDLSIGGIFAMTAVTYAISANVVSLPSAAAIAITVGAAAGLINGFVVTKLRVNTFIGTIGTGAIYSGLALIITRNSPVPVSAENFGTLGLGRFAGIPWALYVAAALFGAAGFVLWKSLYGRHLYATGGNPEAARLAGIAVDRVKSIAFVVTGALGAAGAMIFTSQLRVGQPTIGVLTALDAFTIVAIGGTSVYGGEGAVWRTATGVAILAVLTNVFNAMAWPSSHQNVAKGTILVLAVAVDALRHRRQ